MCNSGEVAGVDSRHHLDGMFFRYKTIDGRTYLYAEWRWREGKKVRSRSRVVGRVGGTGPSSPGGMVPLLPFMILNELATGSRVEQLKAQRGRVKGQGQPAMAWARQKFTNEDRQRMFEKIINSPKIPPTTALWGKARSYTPPATKAREEYMSLREQNRAQINAYWAKVAEPFEKNEKAAEQWTAEHSKEAHSEATGAADNSSRDGGENGAGSAGESGASGL